MGYFEGLTNGLFKKDSANNTVFYPWGVLGSGFIVNSEKERNLIRSFLMKLYMAVLPVTLVIVISKRYWIWLILFPVFVVWYAFMVKRMTKGHPKADEKLKISESYRNSAKSYSLGMLILFELSSLAFVAGGLWMLQRGENPLIAISAIVFFGLGIIVFAYMLVVRVKDKSPDK